MKQNIILIQAAAPPDPPKPSDADYRKEIEVDFSKTHIQILSGMSVIGFGLMAVKFISWLRDIR